MEQIPGSNRETLNLKAQQSNYLEHIRKILLDY